MKYEISLANIWMCLSVIFIHITSYSIPYLDINNNFDIFLLSAWSLSLYVVPGFIFFSGLKSFLKKDFSYPKFLLKRFLTIVIPYIVWSGIYFIYFKFYSDYDFYKTMPAGELFLGILSGNITSHFYFVIAILQFYLLMPLWRIIVKNISPIIGIPISFLIMIAAKQYLIWRITHFYPDYLNYIDKIFLVYIAFWIAGCYAGRYYDSFYQMVNKNYIPICIIYIFSAAVMVTLNFEKYFLSADLPFMENTYILYQTSSILFICLISIRLKKAADLFISKAINSQSYNIYLSHCLVLIAIYNKTAHLQCNTAFLVRFFVTYVVVIGFWSLYYIIKYSILSAKNKSKPKHLI